MLRDLKWILTASIVALPVSAQEDHLSDLFAALEGAQSPEAEQIVDKIGSEWSKSGSPAMDLLLERGRDALGRGDIDTALMHLGALVEKAPDFAEGWNARATAYFQDQAFGPALADIERTLSLNPRHFGAMSGLAIILEDLERPEAALVAWREVQKIYPASPQAERAIPRLVAEVEGQTL